MFKRNRLSTAILSASMVGAVPAHAAIEEVVVTATKRAASTQDIPVAVSALDQSAMNDLGVTNFQDYLIQLPGITAGGSGPGQNTIYIRGVASTTPNLTTAGVAGLAPNVAFYLDEQPLEQPGRNLDVYTADMQRVEVLSGPQGTLFGASSQAGTVRLITNKPDPSGTYANVKLGAAYTKDGEPSNNVEGVFNWAFRDDLTLRAVVYNDTKGGYIDNVRGTRDLAGSDPINGTGSARFRDAGVVRENGTVVSPRRAGFQSPAGIAQFAAAGDTQTAARVADFSNVTFEETDNARLVEDDFNDTTYSGGRLSALWDINTDWSLLVAHARQTIESDGVFFSDPDLDDYEIQRFSDDDIEDSFDNTAWTLEGRIGELEVLYTGAFTDRETDQTVDYTDYLFVGQYLPYYICDTTVTYPEYYGGVPAGTCQAPNLFVKSTTETEVMTHEVRINTDETRRIRATVGAFYRDLELKERNDFTYPGSTDASIFGSIGFSPNFPFDGAYNSDPGPFPPGVIFRNDVKRTDEQMGVYGEVSFDITRELELTLGSRWYDIEVDFEGGANASFCNGFQPDVDRFGTNISDLYDGDGEFTFIGDCTSGGGITFTQGQTFEEISDIIEAADPFSFARGRNVNAPNAISDAEIQGIVNALDAPDTASTSGFIMKGSLTWRPSDTQLWYVTYSEGFRPGLLNRPGGAVGPNGFSVPFELDTDDLTNYELGWKLDLLDRTVRFNGSLFYSEIEDLQTTIFDPSITNLFFSDNAADAEVTGIEGQITWMPASVPGLTVSGAFSILDTEITEVLTPTDDVREGDELAYAPEFQGNLRARYTWDVGNGLRAHVMPHVTYSDESFSDIITINRAKVDSYVLVGFTAGVSADMWTAELYVDNLFDEQAELANDFVFDRERTTYARPTTAGLRVSFGF